MQLIPVTKTTTRHALVIPLKDLPKYEENHMGMVSTLTDLSRVEIFQAAVQIADGLCSSAIGFEPVLEFLNRTTQLRIKKTTWPDSHSFILHLAQAIRLRCPDGTKEVLYQRTTHGQLFLTIGVVR